MTPEGKVKKRVKEILKEAGAYWTMPLGTGFSSSSRRLKAANFSLFINTSPLISICFMPYLLKCADKGIV